MAKTHGQLRPEGFAAVKASPVCSASQWWNSCAGMDPPARQSRFVPLGRQRDVAKACELPGVEAAPRQKAHHRMLPDGLCQVHKAAALGDAGQSPFHRRADRSAYGGVCLQPLRVELGIAAAEVQAVQVFR